MKNGPHTVGAPANFQSIARIDVPRTMFDRSHTYKTTLDGGYLVPIFVDEALPGDSWTLKYRQLCRMTTPIAPFMDNVHASIFFFSVPKRLLWDNFEDFITGSHKGKLGTIHTTYPTCFVTSGIWYENNGKRTIYDYMGIPKPADGKSLEINELPLRAYTLCFNEWFRDENLVDELPLDTSDDSNDIFYLQRRGKRRDYFTSCLPWPQKGPNVNLPLGAQAPVYGNEYALAFSSNPDGTKNNANAYLVGEGTSGDGVHWTTGVGHPNLKKTTSGTAGTNSPNGVFGIVQKAQGVQSGLYADLSDATAATINSLREAFAVQHVLERDARGGTRYVESLLSHFSVQSPDFRLQRPEYLGGGRIDFMVNSVAQTSASDTQSPQGNLSAVAYSVGEVGFQASFVEHCIVLGIICIYTDLTYQQGLNRMWSRSTRFDEYWIEFAHLGEQPVLEKEIYCDGSETDDTVFGYQERYAEYRYKPSMITGKLRSTDAQSLDYWHLAQKFAAPPSLSKDFIEEHPPFERVLAVQNEPQFILASYFDFKCLRPIPMFGTPSLLDHF